MRPWFFLSILSLANFLATPSVLHAQASTIERERTLRAGIPAPAEVRIAPPSDKGPVLLASDFGVGPAASGVENVRRLREALAACKERGASRLVFSAGVHRLRADRPNASKDPQFGGTLNAVELSGFRDFTFDGRGAEFLFESPEGAGFEQRKKGAYFFIQRCERVRVTDLVLDWDWAALPLGFFATVDGVDPEKATVDYLLDAPFRDCFQGPFRVYGMRAWDPDQGTRSTEAFSFAIGNVASQERIGTDHLRITFRNASQMAKARKGEMGLFKTDAPWYAIAFSLDGNDDLAIDRVTLHGSSANGVWARDNRNLAITACRITPRPGTRPVHTAHSALEIHNHRGGFLMEGNLVEWQNDDALHYSDFFVPAGWTRLDERRIRANGLMYFQNRETFRLGDRLTFRDPNFKALAVSSPLVEVTWEMNPGTAKNAAVLRFRDPIPAEILAESFLFNEDSFGKGGFVIRNNLIRNGICMGLAVHMPNGLIENNVVSNVGYPGLMVASTLRWGRWTMGHVPGRVVIRGNLLDRVNRAKQPPGDCFIAMGVEPQGGEYRMTSEPVIANVLFESNVIRGSVWQALVIGSSKDVLVKDNRFIEPNRLPSKPGYGGAVQVRSSERILFDGNRLENPSGNEGKEAIFLDPDARDIWFGDNPGFAR